jgi:hypothetical protein
LTTLGCVPAQCKAACAAGDEECPRIFIQLLLPTSRAQLLQLLDKVKGAAPASDGSQPMSAFINEEHVAFWTRLCRGLTIVCTSELQQALLGHSCMACPGIATLVSNLCHNISLHGMEIQEVRPGQ